MLGKNLITAAAGAGAAGGEVLGIEDVFSTWLYTGNSSTQTITNGIDLTGEGGLVWLKGRSQAYSHYLFDTDRGAGLELITNSSAAAGTSPNRLTSFDSSGFTLNAQPNANQSGETYASWTFRKAEKFFDVVTFTSNGASSQQIAHNLGSVPGCIILKNLDSASYGWYIYHRGTDASVPEQYGLEFTTAARDNNSGYWNNTQPTSTHFSIGNLYQGNTQNYVAYLFAHDAGGFGDDGTESVIKCGSTTVDSSGNATVDLGWEPQWLLIKNSQTAGYDWVLADNMRGISTNASSNMQSLLANTSGSETAASYCQLTSTGFKITGGFGGSQTVIYIAIRRGPMKTPTDATEVFKPVQRAGTSAAATITSPGFPVDLVVNKGNGSGTDNLWFDRLRGATKYIISNSTNIEATNANSLTNFASNVGYSWGNDDGNFSTQTYIDWVFRRAPGFCDVVAYTGTVSAQNVSHNLGVVPELMIIKQRSGSNTWAVYHTAIGAGNFLEMDLSASSASTAVWNNTSPTSTVFSIGTNARVNTSSSTYIAYLFATCPGVSKVGSYTGTGTTLNVDCGFASGARFVLIKRTDASGDWYVWDTARGIVSGNDPYLRLNLPDAENTSTDYIDPLSSGFQISSTAPAAINALGGSYIYLSVA